MKINPHTIQKLSLAIILAFFVSSCAKEHIVSDPLYGLIYFDPKVEVSNDISIINGDDKKIGFTNLLPNSFISGNNRFRFYDKETLLLDTVLLVEPVKKKRYVLFKPNQNTRFRVFDTQFNGLEQEAIPDSGTVKFSMANFSETFPRKVNIYVTTTLVINFRNEQVQVAEFLNVSGTFTGYHTIVTGKDTGGSLVNKYTITVKDPETQAVLAKPELVLDKVLLVNNDRLAGSVYLIYLNKTGTPEILMSKL